MSPKYWIMFVVLDVCVSGDDASQQNNVAARASTIIQRMHKRFTHFLSTQRIDITFGPADASNADVAATNAVGPSVSQTASFAWSPIARQLIDQCPRFKAYCEREGIALSDSTLIFFAHTAMPKSVVVRATIPMIQRAKVQSLKNHPYVLMRTCAHLFLLK
jgi:hypothetical protein